MRELENRLSHIISQSAWLSDVLQTVRDLGPAGAYVAAGAIRDTAWNFLTGRLASALFGDVDVAYFAPGGSDETCRHFERRLAGRSPAVRWEVTNQAHVHRWYRSSMGESVAPFQGVRDAIARWPETATAVGARLNVDGHIEILAPLGLEGLFSMVVRHNPAHGDAPAYRARIASKRWKNRWPELTVMES